MEKLIEEYLERTNLLEREIEFCINAMRRVREGFFSIKTIEEWSSEKQILDGKRQLLIQVIEDLKSLLIDA